MRFLILVWLAIFVLAFSVQWSSESELRELQAHGQMVVGKIVAIQPEFHQTVRYQYEAEGKTFEQVGSIHMLGKTLSEVSVGESVPVYYLPKKPEKSRIADPKAVATNVMPKLLSSFCFSTIVAIISSLMWLLKKNSNYFRNQ